jgi:hypothetical protein
MWASRSWTRIVSNPLSPNTPTPCICLVGFNSPNLLTISYGRCAGCCWVRSGLGYGRIPSRSLRCRASPRPMSRPYPAGVLSVCWCTSRPFLAIVWSAAGCAGQYVYISPRKRWGFSSVLVG